MFLLFHRNHNIRIGITWKPILDLAFPPVSHHLLMFCFKFKPVLIPATLEKWSHTLAATSPYRRRCSMVSLSGHKQQVQLGEIAGFQTLIRWETWTLLCHILPTKKENLKGRPLLHINLSCSFSSPFCLSRSQALLTLNSPELVLFHHGLSDWLSGYTEPKFFLIWSTTYPGTTFWNSLNS